MNYLFCLIENQWGERWLREEESADKACLLEHLAVISAAAAGYHDASALKDTAPHHQAGDPQITPRMVSFTCSTLSQLIATP